MVMSFSLILLQRLALDQVKFFLYLSFFFSLGSLLYNPLTIFIFILYIIEICLIFSQEEQDRDVKVDGCMRDFFLSVESFSCYLAIWGTLRDLPILMIKSSFTLRRWWSLMFLSFCLVISSKLVLIILSFWSKATYSP